MLEYGSKGKMNYAVIFNESGDEIVRRTMGGYKIADMMRNQGWTVEVLDWTTRWTNDEIKQFIDSLPYQLNMVGISNLWMKDDVVIEQIKFLKKEYPNIKIVMGGPKPYQRDFGADVMVFGYSEYALQPVLDWLFDNGPLPSGKFPEWAPDSFLVDANHSYKGLSITKFHVDYHENDFIQSHEALTLEMSRGCRFKCKYCNYAFLGVKEDHSRSEDDLYKEIMENYNRWGTTNYIISDDTFNDRDSKIERLANVVERLPFEPNFSCFIRIDLVISKPHQIELLCRARCWAHFYGIETFADKKNIGIWYNDKSRIKKIAAIGVRISKWIAYHGFSININNNLKKYDAIIPCGIKDKGVTNLYEIKNQNYSKLKDKIIKNFIFNLKNLNV